MYDSDYSPSNYWLIVEQIGLFNFGMVTGLGEKKNSEFKPVKLRLKMNLWRIWLMQKGWVNIYILSWPGIKEREISQRRRIQGSF